MELLANIVYLGLCLHKINVPLPLYYEARKVLPIIIIVGFCFLLLSLFKSKISSVFRLLLLIGIVPLSCWNILYAVMWIEYPLNSVELGERNVFLVTGFETGEIFIGCYLYECDSKSLDCQSTTLSLAETDACKYPTKLIADEETSELHILLKFPMDESYRLYYTDGLQPRHYLDEIEFDNDVYALAYFHEWTVQKAPFLYMLYKCTRDYSCQRLPFQYKVAPPVQYYRAEIKPAEATKEFDVFIGDEVIYTYGENPRCYVEGCSLQDK